MKQRRLSFSLRVSIIITLIVNVFFLLSIVVIAIFSRNIIMEEALKSADNLLKANINEIEKHLQRVEDEVCMVAFEASRCEKNEKTLFELTRSILETDPYVTGSAIAFRKDYFPGHNFYSPYSFRNICDEIENIWLGSETYDYFYMDWYQIPSLLRRPCWSEPYFDDEGGKRFMSTYSYPLFDGEGEVYAIVTADVPLDEIASKISQIKPYKNSYTLLFSRNGSFMSNLHDENMDGETLISSVLSEDNPEKYKIAQAIMRGEEGIARFNEGKISSHFAIYGPLDNGWSACTVCGVWDIMSRTIKMQAILLLLAISGTVIIFLLCYFAIKKQTQPLKLFCNSALSIAKGNFETVLPQLKHKDEVSDLRDSFQYMQQSLTKYIIDLQESTAAKERMESELNVARQLQQDMVPHDFPHNDKIDIGAILVPAKEVGGDLYDFFIKGDNLYFAIGDVSGKGVPAALIMVLTRVVFRFVCNLGLSMDDAMAKINKFVEQSNAAGMFVTMFIGKYDMKTGVLEYCNGGHNPIVISDPDDGPSFLKVNANLAVGLFPDFPYEGHSIKLKKHTTLILYTDGVTEAETIDKDQYGETRLIDWCRDHLAEYDNCSDATAALFSDVKKFTDDIEPNDDTTIMLIRI